MTGVTKMIGMTKVTKVTDLSEDDKEGDPVKFNNSVISENVDLGGKSIGLKKPKEGLKIKVLSGIYTIYTFSLSWSLSRKT